MIEFTAYCPCCGEHVTARYAGFAATSVEVEMCSTLRAVEPISYTRMFRRSAVVQVTGPELRHKTGLVTFG